MGGESDRGAKEAESVAGTEVENDVDLEDSTTVVEECPEVDDRGDQLGTAKALCKEALSLLQAKVLLHIFSITQKLDVKLLRLAKRTRTWPQRYKMKWGSLICNWL